MNKLFKLIVIGDSGVGKTSILNKYINDSYIPTHLSTVGIDLYLKQIEYNNKKIRLQLWDTAGQEIFKSLIKTTYRNAHCVLLCYDVTNMQSFINLHGWYDNIVNNINDHSKFPIIVVVGTKVDLENQRIVSSDDALKFAVSRNIKKYMEISAKSGINIDILFNYFAKELMDKYDIVYNNDKRVINLSHSKLNKNKNKRCC